MSLVEEGNIESKDFSLALPRLVYKLQAIADLCTQRSDDYVDRTIFGIGLVVQEVQEDLEKINRCLYG